jgi:hypothetical protein
MRRPILVLAMAIVFVLAVASSALATNDHPRAAYGKGVIVHCGTPYGQFVKASPHDSASGAKAFILTMAANPVAAEVHGCFQD